MKVSERTYIANCEAFFLQENEEITFYGSKTLRDKTEEIVDEQYRRFEVAIIFNKLSGGRIRDSIKYVPFQEGADQEIIIKNIVDTYMSESVRALSRAISTGSMNGNEIIDKDEKYRFIVLTEIKIYRD